MQAVQSWRKHQTGYFRKVRAGGQLLLYSHRQTMHAVAASVHTWMLHYWQYVSQAAVSRRAASCLLCNLSSRVLADRRRRCCTVWRHRAVQSHHEQNEIKQTVAAVEALCGQRADNAMRGFVNWLRNANRRALCSLVRSWQFNQLTAVNDEHTRQLKLMHAQKLDGLNDVSKQKIMLQTLRNDELAVTVCHLKIGIGAEQCRGVLKQHAHAIQVRANKCTVCARFWAFRSV